MKKNLLLLGAALLMTASAMAQTYTNPRTKAAAPATVPAGSYNYAAEEGGDSLYLWNVKYGGFYANHRDEAHRDSWPYMTRASVNDTIGSKVVFTRQNPGGGELEQGAEWETRDGRTDVYLLVSYVSKFNDYRCTFAEAYDGIWTDNNSRVDRYFHVYADGDYLKISRATCNEVTVEWDLYNFCVRAPEVDTWRCVFLDIPEEKEWQTDPETGEEVEVVTQAGIPDGEEVGDEWAIVSPATYDAYIVEAKTQNTLYALGNQLAALLNSAVADTDNGIRPFLDTQIQILNDASSTAEQLQGAIDAIPDIVVEYKASTVTPDNPANFTTKIINPDFTGGILSGWSGSGWGRGGVVDDAAERFHMNFDTYQDINDLPVGVYKVMVDGFCRSGEAQEDYNAMKAGTIPNPKLYVGCTTFGEFETSMHHASDAALTSDPGYDNSSSVIWEGTTYFIPNSMKAFVGYVTDSKTLGLGDRPYGIAAYGALAEGEALRIGARDTNGGNDWVIVDNFELWYLGATDGAYRVWAQSLLASFPTYDWTAEDVHYGKPERDYYENYRTILGSTTATTDQILEAAKNLPVVMDTVQASFDAYAEYVKEIDWETWLAENKLDITTTEFAILEDYMDGYADGPSATYPNGNAHYILDIAAGVHEGTLSVEEIKAEIQFIKEMKAAALQAGLVKGANFTSLIVNSDFDQTPAGKGWTETHTGNINLRGGLSSNYCAEVWNGTFDIYQDIENESLKKGLYKVNVRAFQRTGNNASAWSDWCAGTAVVTTEVYLNEFATPVQNLQSVQYKEKMGNHRPEATHTVDDVTVYTLDDMSGASTAFSLPDDYSTDNYMNYDPANMLKGEAVLANFKQTVYGLITEQGKLRLGIRCQTPGKDGDYWSLWDKFELYYMGYDVEAIQFVMNDYSKRGDAITSAEVGTDDWDAYDDKRQSLANVMTAEPIALAGLGYEDVESVADPITGEITYDSESLYEDLLAFIELYQNVLTSQAKYAELQAKVDEVNKVFNELYDGLPLALQEKVDGWIGDHQGVNDGSYTDFEQYIEEGNAYIMQMRDNQIDWTQLPVNLTDFIVNPRYEENNNNGWSGTTPGFQTHSNAEVFQGTFDTYQTIMLPRAGYYLLTVRAFERMGNAQNDYEIFTSGKYTENTTTSMYVTVGQLTYEHHICQLAKGAVTTDEMANYSGSWATVGDDLHVTNNMQGAAAFFFDYENNPVDWENIDETAGYYRNPLTFQLDGPSAVTIGLKKPARIIEGYDWVCWSDWKLWYLGNDASGVLVGIDEVTNSNAVAAPVQRSIYSVSGARVQNYQRGLNIVKTLDADGNVRVKKIFVK